MQYQRDHKLTADGLWGHNTNSIQRVLDPSITDKGSYRKSYRTEPGDLVTHKGMGVSATVHDVSPEDFQKMELYYYDHPDEFFDENDTRATSWRQLLHNSGDTGTFYINRMYGLLTPEQRKNVSNKVKTKEIITNEVHDAAAKERDKAAMPILSAIAAPVALGEGFAVLGGGALAGGTGSLVGGLAGGAVGSELGRDLGRKLGRRKANQKDENGYTDIYSDIDALRYGVGSAQYDPNRTIETYGNVGAGFGGLIGTAAGGFLGNAAGNATQVGMNNIVNRGIAVSGYKNAPSRMPGAGGEYSSPYMKMSVKDWWRNFKIGGNASVQTSNSSRTRLGGAYGLKFEGKNPYNCASAETIARANAAINNPVGGAKQVFGQQPNLGISSKIGNAYATNWNGVATTAARMYAPSLGVNYATLGTPITEIPND